MAPTVLAFHPQDLLAIAALALVWVAVRKFTKGR